MKKFSTLLLVGLLSMCVATHSAMAVMWARSSGKPLWQPVEAGRCSVEGTVVQCHGFKLGDWIQRAAACQTESCEQWVELNLNGVMMTGFSYIVKGDQRDYGTAYAAYIEPLSAQTGTRLFVLEHAYPGGPRYMALSAPGKETPIDHADILDMECKNADCRVSSADELEQMARDAAKRPPLASFVWKDDATTSTNKP